MSRQMEFAIWALALVGPIVFSGAFAIPNKTVGLWIGVFGVLMVLLAGALGIQTLIWRKESQPKIALLAPVGRSVLRWDGLLKQNRVSVSSEEGTQSSQLFDVFPAVRLKTLNPTNAVDATVEWRSQPIDIQSLIASSSRLKRFDVVTAGDHITIASKGGGSGPSDMPIAFTMTLSQTATTKVSSITKQFAEATIPSQTWNNAALYFIATLSDTPGLRSNIRSMHR
ncbi:MAG: hypothetical protein JWP51_2970 [Bradyrhizobium sp.]|nr:hypothetical protein [Bradyrhizobium sp.]